MGSVFRAQHLAFDKPVALKVLHTAATDTHMVQRLHREASLLERLSHPNIVKFYAFGTAGDIPFAVMEYLEGCTLAELLRKRGTLSVDECKAIFIQILQGIETAHTAGIVHRDLKPSNVFLIGAEIAPGTVKVLDFGLAKLIQETQANEQKVTKTGAMLGTPHYMSPEQCCGKEAGFASDIYSVGCMLYECLTGAPPFSGDSMYSVLLQHISDAPSVMEKDTQLTLSMERVVLGALAKDPAERYPSAAAFIEALRNPEVLVLPAQTSSRKHHHSPQRRHALIVAITTTLLACFIAGALFIQNAQFPVFEPTEFANRAVRDYRMQNFESMKANFKEALKRSHNRPDAQMISDFQQCSEGICTDFDRRLFDYFEGEVRKEATFPSEHIPSATWVLSEYVTMAEAHPDSTQGKTAVKACFALSFMNALKKQTYKGVQIGGDIEAAKRYFSKGALIARHAELNPDRDYMLLVQVGHSLGDQFRDFSEQAASLEQRSEYNAAAKSIYEDLIKCSTALIKRQVKLTPELKRFRFFALTGCGTAALKQKNFEQAHSYLYQAIQISPNEDDTADFLKTKQIYENCLRQLKSLAK